MLEEYVSLSERARRRVGEASISRLAGFSSWIFESSPDVSPISCYRELALLHAQDAELERALRISELARDRTLGDQFAEDQWLRDAVPQSARRQLEPLQERIQDLDERLAVVSDLMERVRLESERTVTVAQRGRLERELRERLHLGEPESVPPTLDALREHLDGRTALVSVTHSGEAWWALVIRRDEPARFVPFADPDLGRNAAAWVRRLRGEPVRAWPLADGRLALDDLRPAGAQGGFLSTEQLARRLGHALLEPLAAAAGNARHLVFVGDDELVGVPLQALPLGGRLAVDRYDISYAPSLTTYARWQGRPAGGRRRDLLAIGAIDYPRRTGLSGTDTVALGLEFAADHPLPRTRDEIASIAAQFPAARRRLMVGAGASKSDLRAASRSGELAHYRYVHLATHAWVDPDRPEASAVVLASDGSELPLQVVLTAAELAGLRMRADLIVLSACDTGAGHFEHGRGLLGLAYAALAAGNRAAVLSLWPIADDSTVPFMTHFYARLARGNDPVAALAATQREFRDSPDPRLADPAVWAPFLIYGGY
jgi:CHAT domain-containing protein